MKKEINKFVGSKIKEYRKKAGFTQKELGKRVGVKHNTISSYENGTNEPEQKILYSIANAVDVSINDFFPSTSYADTPSILSKEFQVAESKAEYRISKEHKYDYFTTAISAGLPITVDGVTETEKITLPDSLMGRWVGHEDIKVMHVNGESMNRVIPDQSIIAVKPTSIENLKDNDIVVYHEEYEYSTKRFINDKTNERLIFRPDSTDLSFTENIVKYEDANNLKIEGKVVLYIVEMD